jgi:hypothetical protein
MRALSWTPGTRANWGVRKSGMKLQICRSWFSFEAAGMVAFLFFIPAVWQHQTNHSSFFQNLDG